MSKKAICLATLLLMWLGCSVDPMPLPPHLVPDTEETTADHGTQPTGGETGDTGETQSVTGGTDVPATEDTVETVDLVDTVDPGDCPWQCLPLTGPNACDAADAANSIHNANYTCGNEGYVCCQPPNAKGGIRKACNDQPAMSCQTECGEGLVQNNGFYCKSAKLLCCEDPNGPAPTCAEVGGTCIPSFFYECDDDETEVELECDNFGETCCLPPPCPWGCVEFNGENTCSQGKNPPVATRNYDYSCEHKGEVCCQPYEIIDTDTSDTDTGTPPMENCNKQGSLFSCESSCGDYERQRVDFYCPAAGARCCEDIRKDCESGLGGTCDNDFFGGCADGYEANPGGRCPADWMGEPTCCTQISPYNQCAKEGGVCVDVSDIENSTDILTACPLGYTPKITTMCGDFRLCCKPLIGG